MAPPAAGCGHFSLFQAGRAAARPGILSEGPLVTQDREQQEACHPPWSSSGSKAHRLPLEGREMELSGGRFIKLLQWPLLTEIMDPPAPPAAVKVSGRRMGTARQM